MAELSDEASLALACDTDPRHEGGDGVAYAMTAGTPTALSAPR